MMEFKKENQPPKKLERECNSTLMVIYEINTGMQNFKTFLISTLEILQPVLAGRSGTSSVHTISRRWVNDPKSQHCKLHVKNTRTFSTCSLFIRIYYLLIKR